MWESNVAVIKIGTSAVDPGNAVSDELAAFKHRLGVGGGSTVCVIREAGDILLADTGFDKESDDSPANRRANRESLEFALGRIGLKPADVTKVFITHFHRDHFGNIEMFGHAQWYCHRLELAGNPDSLAGGFTPMDDGQEILPNTKVLHSPGHTRGHGSLLWRSKDGTVRIAVCGDAILSLAWLQSGHTWKFNGDFYGTETAQESAAKLLGQADLIIPGHGEPFFVATAMRRTCTRMRTRRRNRGGSVRSRVT